MSDLPTLQRLLNEAVIKENGFPGEAYFTCRHCKEVWGTRTFLPREETHAPWCRVPPLRAAFTAFQDHLNTVLADLRADLDLLTPGEDGDADALSRLFQNVDHLAGQGEAGPLPPHAKGPA